MDPKELEAKRAEAKAAGYTDAEIDEFLNPPAAPPIVENPRAEQNKAIAQFGALAGAEQLGEIGKKAIEYGGPAAAIGYGAYKGGQAIANRAGPVAPAAPTTTFTGGANPAFDEALSKPYNPSNPTYQGPPVQQTAPAQSAPTTSSGRTFSPQAQQYLQAEAAHKAEQAAAAQRAEQMAAQQAMANPTAQNFMQRMATIARQYGPMVGKVGATGVALGTYSPELGPRVPRTGRLRGSEINPFSGRPWTAAELDAYERNPTAADSQLPH